MNIYFKLKKGASLIVVLMVMAVVFTLGIVILGIGVAEARFSTHQVNKTQAYLSAKSGVEIGYKKIKDKLATENYYNVEDLYNDINDTFSGSVNTGEDTYTVKFICDDGLLAQNRIKISGEAFVNNIKGTTALTLQFTSPDRIPLDWLNPGQIIKKGYFSRTTGPVIVDVAKSLGHAPKKSSTQITTWNAPSIHFVDNDEGFSLEVTAKQLVLQANIISFRKKIYIKDDNDCLVLKTFSSGGFLGENGEKLKHNDVDDIPDGWGVVVLYDDIVKGNNKNQYSSVFSKGYYAFNPGTALSKDADRTDSDIIIKITNESTINYIETVIKHETALGFEPTQIKWSND